MSDLNLFVIAPDALEDWKKASFPMSTFAPIAVSKDHGLFAPQNRMFQWISLHSESGHFVLSCRAPDVYFRLPVELWCNSSQTPIMRLRQIEIFYHVYRAGSISGAARELHVSQPSVSKVLRYAEDQLGFDLFTRQKGRLYPTPAAHELYDEIKDIYRRISSFNRTANNIRNRKGGHIRFGVLPSLSLSVAPDAISRLRKFNSDLSFELTTLHSDELASALIEKKCDICIGFEDVHDERINVQQLAQGQLVLVADQDMEKESGKIDLSVLDGADFIGMKASGPLADLLADALQQEDITPHEVVTAHTYYLALALVQKGVGLAVTDEFTAYSPLGSDLYKYRLVDVPEFPICALSLSDHLQPTLIESCMVELKAVLS